MRDFKIEVGGANLKTINLIQLESEPNLWKIVEEKKKEEEEGYWRTNATVLGLVMTYVDDIFVVGSEDVASAVAQENQSTWTVTGPEVVSEIPVRFLGMDILKVKEEEGTEGWMINQEPYVKDLVGRKVGEEKEKRIPINRDQSYMEADKDPPTLEKIRQCQKEVGEILWLVTRSRPDLMHATSRMASHVTKASMVLETTRQVRGYLKRTAGEGLLYQEEKEKEPTIRVFTDASFSPEGEESHECFVVMLNDCLLFWRSGGQSTITLSTAESELNEIVEGMNGGEAVAVIISELCEVVHKEGWTDSQSAAGERRRELANQTLEDELWLRPTTSEGEWRIGHVPGPFA